MKRITFARLAVLLLAAGALALSGCGGDDNGIDQSLQDSVTADRDTEKARADAAVADAATEKARADAAEALAATETMRADEAEGMLGDGQEAMDAATQTDMNNRAPDIIDAMAEADETEPPMPPERKVSRTADGTVIVSGVGFTKADDMAPPMIEGWHGTTLTRAKIPPTGTDAVYVYTDIEAPMGTTFAKAYGDPVTINADNTAKAMSDKFPDASDRTATLGATLGVAEKWAGTFDGIPGTFECTIPGGAGCVVNSDADGDVTFPALAPDDIDPTNDTVVIFKPTDAGAMVMAAVDTDYLTFGFWLSKPAVATPNTEDHDFAAFYSGTDAYIAVAAVYNAFTGTARYKGDAAGKYVIDDQVDTARIGIFTAAAELEIVFDAADEDDVGISGAITKFMENGTPLGEWSVTLGTSVITPSIDATTAAVVTPGGITTATLGDTGDLAGVWEAKLYGNGRRDDKPGSVAGKFSAFDAAEEATSSVALSGAFGAYNTTMETTP